MARHTQKLKRGLWSPEEDEKLHTYITRFGVGCWSSVPKLAGLQRCGKSCRLRWINYLRPDLKRGMFSQEEEDLIINIHQALGNRWAQIAAQLPGRTDNEIKNFWNSSLKKKLLKQGIDPSTHKIIKKVEKECMDSPSSLQSVQQYQGIQFQDSSENFMSKQVFDPLFFSEFPTTFVHSNFKTEGDHQTNPVSGFIDSLPNLTNFNHQSMIDTNGSSRNSSNDIKINNIVDNPSTYSWDEVNESVFEFKVNPWEEETSQDYSSNYPFGLTMPHLDGFQP